MVYTLFFQFDGGDFDELHFLGIYTNKENAKKAADKFYEKFKKRFEYEDDDTEDEFEINSRFCIIDCKENDDDVRGTVTDEPPKTYMKVSNLDEWIQDCSYEEYKKVGNPRN